MRETEEALPGGGLEHFWAFSDGFSPLSFRRICSGMPYQDAVDICAGSLPDQVALAGIGLRLSSAASTAR